MNQIATTITTYGLPKLQSTADWPMWFDLLKASCLNKDIWSDVDPDAPDAPDLIPPPAPDVHNVDRSTLAQDYQVYSIKLDIFERNQAKRALLVTEIHASLAYPNRSPSLNRITQPQDLVRAVRAAICPRIYRLPAGSALNTAPATGSGPAQRLHAIPVPASKEAHRRWQLEQMAAAFRIFDRLGYADGASGHISVRDPVEPDTFWINPYAVHFGCLTVSDMVRVDRQGRRVGGAADRPVNTAGFVIHAAVHAARPDLHAACHVHSPYGRAWSTFGRGLDMLNQDSCMFYDDLSVYANFGGVVFAAEEGQRLAAALGPRHRNLILQNHGLMTCGGTVAEAAAFFIALERACQAQLLVEGALANAVAGGSGSGSGLRKTLVGEAESRYTKDGTGTPEAMYMQFVPEYQRILKETGGDFLR